MTVNLGSVVRVIGVLFIVLGVCMMPSLAVAIIYKEFTSAVSFAVTAVPCVLAGLLITKKLKPEKIKMKARDGYLFVTLAWLLASVIGGVPLVISGNIPSPADAFFEMCSGFSTTGSTILTDVEALSKSMLFWRSFTHWLGGMGIIVFAAALLPSIGVSGQMIASAETPGPTFDKLSAKYSDTAKSLYILYFGITLVQTVLLMFGGVTLYDSLVHTFGTVGTGGFSVYNNSIGHYDSAYVEWVITIFMLLCGINFNLYFLIPRGGLKSFFADEELRFYLLMVFGSIGLITICLMTQGDYDSLSEGIRDSAFHVSSVVTTTGYATMDYDTMWPTFAKMILLILTITGACSSSTGGGVKMIRIVVALKFAKRGFSRKLHPNRVADITLNGRGLEQTVVTNIINFIMFYILVLMGGTLIVCVDGFDLVTTFSAVLTCLGNVGPGFNLVGPVLNFSIFSDFSKVILGLIMIAGRLELFTFFILFSPKYWNSNRV